MSKKRLDIEVVMNLNVLNKFEPITLDEMSGIRLMNRTDTKFVTTLDKLLTLLNMAQQDYYVQDMSGNRCIPYYTMYFDTPERIMYKMHHRGHVGRQKVRIRSYVNSHLSFLEVKTKDNHGRTKKKRIEISSFDPRNPDYDIRFHNQDETSLEHGRFLSKYLFLDPESLEETLENNFNRITLVNKAKTERLTIDVNLKFHNLSTDRNYSLDRLVIIELKRDGLQKSPILGLLNQLRIKPMGFSKYCMGSALTSDGDLPLNNFKLRLRAVRKILNA